jgi:hypothetical protein
MTNRNDNELPDGVLRFLRSLEADRWPADLDEELTNPAAVLERLRSLGVADDDAWIARTLEREQWIGHVLRCLNDGAVDHETSPGTSPLGVLLAAVATATVALGAQAGLAECALNARGDLEPSERELLEQAVRDAAASAARAWARVDQAQCLLDTIEGEGDV